MKKNFSIKKNELSIKKLFLSIFKNTCCLLHNLIFEIVCRDLKKKLLTLLQTVVSQTKKRANLARLNRLNQRVANQANRRNVKQLILMKMKTMIRIVSVKTNSLKNETKRNLRVECNLKKFFVLM